MTQRRWARALGGMGALLLALGWLAAWAPARAATEPAAAAQSALTWLLTRQQNDGSFAGFDAGASADAIFALVAAGKDPNSVQKNGASPLAYLQTQAGQYATKSVAGAGKLALAVVAAGGDPLSFGGQNLVGLILKSYSAGTGQYGGSTTDHAYALLGLAATGQSIPPEALAALDKLQLPDGGWSFDGTAASGSDTNTTALVAQALVAAGSKGATLDKAVAYLKSQQNSDGGFPYSKASSFGSASDANSTAAVIQGLLAAGVDPRTLKQGAADPLTALVAFQNSTGALRYQTAAPEDNDLATAQAIPALLLKPHPLKRASLPAQSAPAATAPSAPSARLPGTGGSDGSLWPLVAGLALLLAGRLLLKRA
ncbi:MAG TPA: prenyltransferase/squalene oxidase repeat-containing protein [Roseiflexaceae bacterium]|nr:prenyltransferase/squalene oxidase repeat-containing protein [Roseiflexaceae bacterium]